MASGKKLANSLCSPLSYPCDQSNPPSQVGTSVNNLADSEIFCHSWGKIGKCDGCSAPETSASRRDLVSDVKIFCSNTACSREEIFQTLLPLEQKF